MPFATTALPGMSRAIQGMLGVQKEADPLNQQLEQYRIDGAAQEAQNKGYEGDNVQRRGQILQRKQELGSDSGISKTAALLSGLQEYQDQARQFVEQNHFPQIPSAGVTWDSMSQVDTPELRHATNQAIANQRIDLSGGNAHQIAQAGDVNMKSGLVSEAADALRHHTPGVNVNGLAVLGGANGAGYKVDDGSVINPLSGDLGDRTPNGILRGAVEAAKVLTEQAKQGTERAQQNKENAHAGVYTRTDPNRPTGSGVNGTQLSTLKSLPKDKQFIEARKLAQRQVHDTISSGNESPSVDEVTNQIMADIATAETGQPLGTSPARLNQLHKFAQSNDMPEDNLRVQLNAAGAREGDVNKVIARKQQFDSLVTWLEANPTASNAKITQSGWSPEEIQRAKARVGKPKAAAAKKSKYQF